MTTHHGTVTAFPGLAAKDTAHRNRTYRRRLTRSEVVFRTTSGTTLTANAPPGARPAWRIRMRRAR